MAPPAYLNDGDPLPNPPVDPGKPQMSYPEGALEMIANAPDEAMLNSVENRPPSPNGL